MPGQVRSETGSTRRFQSHELQHRRRDFEVFVAHRWEHIAPWTRPPCVVRRGHLGRKGAGRTLHGRPSRCRGRGTRPPPCRPGAHRWGPHAARPRPRLPPGPGHQRQALRPHYQPGPRRPTIKGQCTTYLQFIAARDPSSPTVKCHRQRLLGDILPPRPLKCVQYQFHNMFLPFLFQFPMWHIPTLKSLHLDFLLSRTICFFSE